MTQFFRVIGACLLGFVLSPFPAAPAIAVEVISQAPCPLTLGGCTSFNSTQPIPVIRSISFNMTGAGKALVRFDGTMVCLSQSAAADENVNLQSQIVTNANAVANFSGPGGNKHSVIFHRKVLGAFGTSTTFNLASGRLIDYGFGGPKAVYFKLNRVRMDALTRCVIAHAVFIVETFP